MRLFYNHDGGIDQLTKRDGDPGERHDVGADAQHAQAG